MAALCMCISDGVVRRFLLLSPTRLFCTRPMGTIGCNHFQLADAVIFSCSLDHHHDESVPCNLVKAIAFGIAYVVLLIVCFSMDKLIIHRNTVWNCIATFIAERANQFLSVHNPVLWVCCFVSKQMSLQRSAETNRWIHLDCIYSVLIANHDSWPNVREHFINRF